MKARTINTIVCVTIILLVTCSLAGSWISNGCGIGIVMIGAAFYAAVGTFFWSLIDSMLK